MEGFVVLFVIVGAIIGLTVIGGIIASFFKHLAEILNRFAATANNNLKSSSSSGEDILNNPLVTEILKRTEEKQRKRSKKKKAKKSTSAEVSLETSFSEGASLEAVFKADEVSLEESSGLNIKVEPGSESRSVSISKKKTKILDFSKESLVRSVVWNEILKRKINF